MHPKQSAGLFEREARVAGRARELLNGGASAADWPAAYRQLADEYDRLVELMHKLVTISDKQSRALKRRELQLQSLLNHAGQGFFMFEEELVIRLEGSEECYRLFGRRIAGMNVDELIWQEPERQAEGRLLLQRLFQAKTLVERSDLLRQLPHMLERNDLSVKLDYHWVPLSDPDEGGGSVIVVVTDTSEEGDAHSKLEALRSRDRLTGVFTREYAEEAISQWIEFDLYPISLIMVDMNGLKLMNDVFGHAGGDELLVRAVQVLRQGSRHSDLISRWGGDEFLLLLPGTDEAGCERVVNRLSELASASAPDPIRVSFAIGSATIAEAPLSTTEWMAAAESRMYKHKFEQNRAVKQQMIEDLAELLERGGYVHPGHLKRVADMACRFACLSGNGSDDGGVIRQMRLLAKLHDIGKLSLAKARDALDAGAASFDDERTAAETAYRLASAIGEFEVADWILLLQRRWDEDEAIARSREGSLVWPVEVFKIVNLYDEMRFPANGEAGLSAEAAVERLRAKAGTELDPVLAYRFISELDRIAAEA